MEDDYQDVKIGQDVYSSDSRKLGEVRAIFRAGANAPAYFEVKKGFMSRGELFVPLDAVLSVDRDSCYLKYTYQECLKAGWEKERPHGEAISEIGAEGKAYGEEIDPLSMEQ